jgi:hypothetical protein
VMTLDTGRFFPETFELWARTEHLYGRRILAVYPDRDDAETASGHPWILRLGRSATRMLRCPQGRTTPAGPRRGCRMDHWLARRSIGSACGRLFCDRRAPSPPYLRRIRCSIGPANRWSRTSKSTTFPTILCTTAASLRSAAPPVRAP